MNQPVRAKLAFDVDEAAKSANEFFDTLGRKGLAINQTFELLGRGVDFVERALSRAVETALELAKAADVQEKAERKFLAAAEGRTASTTALLARTQEFNAALQAQTGIGDEVVLGLQAQLLRMGVYEGDLRKATLATIGFSRAHDVDLGSAVKTVGKIIKGNTEGLKEYGLYITDVNAAINRYADASRLATTEGKTLAGGVEVLKADWGDLLEELGKVVTQSAVVKQRISETDSVVLALSKSVKENRGALLDFFDQLVGKAGSVGDKLQKLGGIAYAVLPQALKPLGLAVAGVGRQEETDEARRKMGEQQGTKQHFAKLALELEQESQLLDAKQQEIETRNTKRAEDLLKQRIAKRVALLQALFREQLAYEVGWAEERRRRLAQEEQYSTEVLFELRLQAYQTERSYLDELENQKVEDMQRRHELVRRQIKGQANDLLDDEKLAQSGLSQEQQTLVSIAFQGFDVVQKGLGQSIGVIVAGLVEGKDNIAEAVGGIFKGLLNQMGDSLIGMSMAALALQALSLIPFFEGFTGPPGLSAAAAGIALGAGVGVKALAAALPGGGGGGGGASSTPRSGVVPAGSGVGDRTRARAENNARLEELRNQRQGTGSGSTGSGAGYEDRFATSSGSTSRIEQHHHYHFQGVVVAQSQDALALRLDDMRRRADRLRGRRPQL